MSTKRPGNLPPHSHPANSTNYFIPADNPFVDITNYNGTAYNPTNIRTEFFSIGYRNPCRFSIDPLTGFIYVGDVGQDINEEVDVITNGANCGWAWYEGLHLAQPLYPGQPGILTNPPAGLVFPIQEYPHSGTAAYIGNAVIGGVVYRGNRITQLYGAYVFTDNGSGNVWMLRYDGQNTVPFQQITTASSPSALGIDPRNGDVLICQLGNNQIGRLDYNATVTGAPLPPTLADTGAFTNLTTLAPATGIVSYDINVPFWSDNAVKSRWVSVPNPSLTIGFNANGNWSFPTGTVWIKHFDLELTNGSAASTKRVETRFIIINTNGIYGITYRWDSPTNATLVPEEGKSMIPSSSTTAARCALKSGTTPAAPNASPATVRRAGTDWASTPPQLNRNLTYGTLTTNEISALQHCGLLQCAGHERRPHPAGAGRVHQYRLQPGIPRPLVLGRELRPMPSAGRCRPACELGCAHHHADQRSQSLTGSMPSRLTTWAARTI